MDCTDSKPDPWDLTELPAAAAAAILHNSALMTAADLMQVIQGRLQEAGMRAAPMAVEELQQQLWIETLDGIYMPSVHSYERKE